MKRRYPLGVAMAALVGGCASVLGADFDRPGPGGAADGGADVTTDVAQDRPGMDGLGILDGEAAAADGLAEAATGTVVLLGGYHGNTVPPDGWTFDGTSWTQACSACPPPARYLATMATRANQVVLFGGGSSGLADASSVTLQDTWTFNGTSWTQVCEFCAPPARYRSMMAAIGGLVVLFGGQDGSDLQDTWTFDGAAWAQVCATCSPPARDTGSMATLGNEVVLFGGWDASGASLRDTWTFDGTAWTEVCDSCAPPARGGAAMATLGKSVVLFGGRDGSTFLQDTWIFDGTNWTQACSTCAPSPRYQTTMASLGSKVVLFGGENGSDTKFQDTWTFDGATWTQVATCPGADAATCDPAARAGVSMATLP